MNKALTFLREVRIELIKVNWPSKHRTFIYSCLVIFISVIVAIFLGSLDYIFGLLLNKFILQ